MNRTTRLRATGLLCFAALALEACGAASTDAAATQQANSTKSATANQSDRAPIDVPPPLFPRLERVVDRAELLTAAQEAELTERSAALEARTTDQLVIVTVSSLGGRSIEDYSRELGNAWSIGQADQDNGVLVLVAPNEREVRIAVGYGLEPILTNARASEIIERDFLPRFREQQWFGGIDAGTQSIIRTLVSQEDAVRRGRP